MFCITFPLLLVISQYVTLAWARLFLVSPCLPHEECSLMSSCSLAIPIRRYSAREKDQSEKQAAEIQVQENQNLCPFIHKKELFFHDRLHADH